MSKHSSAPISDLTRSSLARARRSRRRRSKSTRFSQSTAIVPYVGRAIEFLLRKQGRGQRAAVKTLRKLLPLQSDLSPLTFISDLVLSAAHLTRGLKHGLLGRHGHILQRRRKRNWNMHRAHALDRSVQIVECACSDHRRKFGGDAVAFVTFVEDDCPRRFLCRFDQRLFVEWPHGAWIDHFGTDSDFLQKRCRA